LAFIDVSIDKRVAEVTLNRPEKLNAMHEVMLEEFDAAIASLRDDRGVNCVLPRVQRRLRPARCR
jgi:enoyl-CoA hydratase/carnithine racemase